MTDKDGHPGKPGQVCFDMTRTLAKVVEALMESDQHCLHCALSAAADMCQSAAVSLGMSQEDLKQYIAGAIDANWAGKEKILERHRAARMQTVGNA